MLTHEQIWRGIDRLALRNEMSPSGLAKRAGLDPTTFNKSKRITKEGKYRWPSTESLSKILEATSTSMTTFVSLVETGTDVPEQKASTTLRSISFSRLGEAPLDVSGFPKEGGWEEIDFPMIEDSEAYMVELDSDVAPPTYRAGDLLVISPSSSIRRHDRVLVRQKSGAVLVAAFLRRSAQRCTFAPVDRADQEYGMDIGELAWMARIIWISQ